MTTKRIVLDANILIRAVLGKKVRQLLLDYADEVEFCAPSIAFTDAAAYLPQLLEKRGVPASSASPTVESLRGLVTEIPPEITDSKRAEALLRIGRRDADDWPIASAALALACPIWTEDRDFFGSGIPTWTTDLVELYLDGSRDEDAPD